MRGAATEPSAGAGDDRTSAARSPGIQWLFPGPAGVITLLDRPRVLLGRDGEGPGDGLGTQVSRRHAEVHCQGQVIVMSDLGSTNGTFVNGVPIRDRPLRPGDVIRLGTWVGVVLADAVEALGQGFGELAPGLFAGPDLAAVLAPLRALAPHPPLPLVIEGETGTGKERVARAAHLWSGRSGPFVAINAAAIPEAIAEAELFGHRRGAFTGAERAGIGYLRAADGGTLLIDEIIDLSPAIQAKLLRCLENREVVPLGETAPIPIDVRLVAATQIPLRQAVEEKKLRGDLVARLDGLTVRLPPLRERIREVPFLFARFMAAHLGSAVPPVSARLVERLCLFDWPFNVRELERESARLAAQYGGAPLLRESHLSIRLLRGERADRPAAADEDDPELQAATLRETLRSVLAIFHGNVARSAEALGISRQRAYRLMEGSSPAMDPGSLRPGATEPLTPPDHRAQS